MVSTNGTDVKESVKEQRFQQRLKARQEAFQSRQRHDRILNEFQPDAVEIEKQTVPGGVRWTLYTVIGLICCCVGWSYWAQVDQIVTAQGKLITTVPPILVDTKLSSPIRSVNVKFGDRVVAGQVLATLDPTFTDADVNQLEAKRHLLAALTARLNAELEGKPFDISGNEQDLDWAIQLRAYTSRKNNHQAKLREFAAEQSKINVQRENNLEEIKFYSENFVDYRKYEEKIKNLADRGSSSGTQLLSSKLQSNDAKMKVQQGRSRSLELAEELESLRTRKEAFLASARSEVVLELVDAHEKKVEIEQELLKAKQSKKYVTVRVPDSLPYKEFVVLEVSDNSVGSIMDPGEPLCRLVPVGVPVEAEVEVAGKDIARLSEVTKEQIESGEIPDGSSVRVKLASFPYQKHGTLTGAIRKISEDSFEKETPNGPLTMYRARVQLLDPIKMENVPESFRLMPGMTTTAEIKVGRRRVIEYFLYPLLRYMDESIREP